MSDVANPVPHRNSAHAGTGTPMVVLAAIKSWINPAIRSKDSSSSFPVDREISTFASNRIIHAPYFFPDAHGIVNIAPRILAGSQIPALVSAMANRIARSRTDCFGSLGAGDPADVARDMARTAQRLSSRSPRSPIIGIIESPIKDDHEPGNRNCRRMLMRRVQIHIRRPAAQRARMSLPTVPKSHRLCVLRARHGAARWPACGWTGILVWG